MGAVVLSSSRREAIITCNGYGYGVGLRKGRIQHLLSTFLSKLTVSSMSEILNLTDREAIVHNIEEDFRGDNPPQSFCLVFRVLSPRTIKLEWNPFDLSNSFPLDELTHPNSNVDQSLAAAVNQFLTTEDHGAGSSVSAPLGSASDNRSLGMDQVTFPSDHQSHPVAMNPDTRTHFGENPTGVLCDMPAMTTHQVAAMVHENTTQEASLVNPLPRLSEKAKGKAIAGVKRTAFLPQTIVVGDSLRNILKRALKVKKMASLDDEDETLPLSVSNYHFVDEKDELVSFSVLPIQWWVTEKIGGDKPQVFLNGIADNGLQQVFKQVKAWRFDLSDVKPEISVLSKENDWIILQKPRKSFEDVVRSVLIVVNCLHVIKRNPYTSGKYLWSEVFRLCKVRHSEFDLADHSTLIAKAIKRHGTLARSKFLLEFLDEKPRKRKRRLLDEEKQATSTPRFIVEETDEKILDNVQQDDSDNFDICTSCDDGGNLLSCTGSCLRSFHPTVESGREASCISLGYTEDEVESIQYLCKNCEYKQHQCYVCGTLGSSDNCSGAEVFRCVLATCGKFYHPRCVANLLSPDDGVSAEDLEKKISNGESFTYVALKLTIENACQEHEIDENIGTPLRNHVKFPIVEKMKCTVKERNISIGEKRQKKTSELLAGQRKIESTARILPSEKSHVGRTNHNGSKQGNKSFSASKVGGTITGKLPVGSSISKKAEVNNTSREDLNPSMDDENSSLGDKLYTLDNERLGSVKQLKLDSADVELKKAVIVDPTSKRSNSEHLPLDADREKRLLELMKDAESSINIEDIKQKNKVTSVHIDTQYLEDKETITPRRLEVSVGEIQAALHTLNEGSSIEDAKAVCSSDVLEWFFKWKDRLGIYLSPFLHDMHYTSFGRHFTKVEKLEEIINKLHWYVQDGDMCLNEKKLDKTGKKCSFKNYDIMLPKNDFCFEERDWMSVKPKELPSGSKLIMGLHPPFGVGAKFAKKFIDKALKFKPKVLILIAPPETERLDEQELPYDLVWEDDHLLSGKSFYIPGSADVKDKLMEQWNAKPPLLYLWSRFDWSATHMEIAESHAHIFKEDYVTDAALIHDHSMGNHDNLGEIPDHAMVDCNDYGNICKHALGDPSDDVGDILGVVGGEECKDYSPLINSDKGNYESSAGMKASNDERKIIIGQTDRKSKQGSDVLVSPYTSGNHHFESENLRSDVEGVVGIGGRMERSGPVDIKKASSEKSKRDNKKKSIIGWTNTRSKQGSDKVSSDTSGNHYFESENLRSNVQGVVEIEGRIEKSGLIETKKASSEKSKWGNKRKSIIGWTNSRSKQGSDKVFSYTSGNHYFESENLRSNVQGVVAIGERMERSGPIDTKKASSEKSKWRKKRKSIIGWTNTRSKQGSDKVSPYTSGNHHFESENLRSDVQGVVGIRGRMERYSSIDTMKHLVRNQSEVIRENQ
ncbi:hypothetical protein F8388_010524 [Cannabis sativa]|uniref:Uncharacterized protein n=1 Tax=Cannabis sativa TaxID=3483 RepID=A0A7J6GPR8_CANSA|nr:hypothetical protein G4B88_022894 [Cannabis sativa]KAF4384926.1 hypothetical protein F8388_010524 [Cannabis sativa]